jgi:hypothetical protein
MESFFPSLRTERTARETYRTRDEAKADVFECLYNPKRRHSTIGYKSPTEFEMPAGLGREPINLPGGRLARVRYAPIATKFRSAAK